MWNTIGNIIWLLFGGLAMGIAYFVSGTAMICTVVGIPFGLQIYKLGLFSLWPFGTYPTANPSSSGCLFSLLTIIWWIVGGLWTALGHLLLGVLFCITIIGIPFGNQHFKLARLALFPFRKSW